MTKLYQQIFSITNENEHKIFRILGFKLKFKDKEKLLENKLNKLYEALLSLPTIVQKMDTIQNEIRNNKTDIEHLSWAIRDKFYGIVNGAKFSPCETLVAEAHESSVKFIKENMDLNKLLLKHDRISNLKYSVTLAQNNGLILEFGVFSGETINIIADYFKNDSVYGFDSFEGLPEDWNGWALEKSFFKRDNLPEVRDNVSLIKGWFNETLPKFLEQHPEKVAFLHVDSDIYSSAKYVLISLKDRIQKGTVIVFDEFFNFPNWENHEYKAFMEFLAETGYQFEYISIGHDQVTVKII